MRRRTLLLAVLLATTTLVGCLGEDGDPSSSTPPGAAGAELGFRAPVNVSEQWPGAEPVVDVGPDGTIYVEGVGTYEDENGTTRGVNKVFRSTDDGRTWTDITPQGPGQEETGDGFVAVAGDGTVYAANVFELTFQVYRSEDQGETWTPLNMPRIPALMHRHWIVPEEGAPDTLHVTVEALPPGAVPFLAGGPSLEGTAESPNQGMWYFQSTDGGDTWSTPARVDPQINYAGQSDLAVGPDGEQMFIVRYEEEGTAPLEYTYEEGTFYLMASEDGGESWERREMFGLDASIASALTSLTLGPEDRLYFVWSQAQGNRSVTQLAVSEDGGETWTRTALDLSDGTQAMPFATSLAPGVLGIVWYDAHAEGQIHEVDAPWHVHYARVDDAHTANPNATAVKVSGTVHEGSICVKGPTCSATGGDRRLLDYPWITTGPDGRVHLAFASTQWDRPSAFPVHAVEPS